MTDPAGSAPDPLTDLDALEALAEAAMSGFEAETASDWYSQPEVLFAALSREFGKESWRMRDAAFIVGAKPSAVRALVARVREAEAGLAYLRENSCLRVDKDAAEAEVADLRARLEAAERDLTSLFEYRDYILREGGGSVDQDGTVWANVPLSGPRSILTIQSDTGGGDAE